MANGLLQQDQFMSPEDMMMLDSILASPTMTPQEAGFAAASTGAMMLPGSSIPDVLGYAPNPFQAGEYLPSFAENVMGGQFFDATMQGVGLLGDVMTAASPLTGGLLLAPAAAAKSARAASLAKQGERLKKMSEAERVKLVKDLPYVGTEEFPLEGLLGKEVIYMPADRMRAGIVYEGLPEAPIERPRGLRGGQMFGTTEESVSQGLGFASLDPSIAKRFYGSGADYAIIGAMDKYSQLSNRDMADIIAQQVQAYQREGYITKANMKALRKRMIDIGRANENKLKKHKQTGTKPAAATRDLAALRKIPPLDSPEIFDFLRDATFETRKQFGLILNQASSRELGAPSIDRILQETIDPEQAGAMSMQGNILVRLDKKAPIDVERAGGIPHPSYPIGIFGEPVAQIKYGVRAEDLFSETVAEWLSQGGDPSRIQRKLSMSLPKTEITGEKLALFPTGAPGGITSARQAQLLTDFMSDNWRTTTQLKKEGGLGPADVRVAFENNALAETLTPYSEQQIKQGKKDGSLVFYGLGKNDQVKGNNGQIFFGLKRGVDYNKEYMLNNPELTSDEVAIVGVMNNEFGKAGQGLGVPTAMLKGIEEGATVLDAYAVPSAKHPKGFLPEYYSQFGFEEVERIPFKEEFVRKPEHGGSERKYQALLKQWRDSGWVESMGYPDMVIMKWRGSDDDRANAVRNYVEQSGGSVGREARGFVQRARGGTGQSSGAGVRQPSGASVSGDGGRNRGGLLGDGNVLPSRFSRAIGEIPSLTAAERRSLGLLD